MCAHLSSAKRDHRTLEFTSIGRRSDPIVSDRYLLYIDISVFVRSFVQATGCPNSRALLYLHCEDFHCESTHRPLGDFNKISEKKIKLILVTDGCDISSEIALRWTSLDLSDDKSTLVQVMAWCRQAKRHFLNQCWPRSLPPYGVTRPPWMLNDTPYFAVVTINVRCVTLVASPHHKQVGNSL